ncbi:MAG: phage head closure protein [Gallionella sp.]|jgi:SPP1 family predicted phage head-tail adaptor
MSLQSGYLRHRVALQRPTYSQNTSTGEQTLTWVDVATVWAAIEPLSAREFMAAQSEQSQIDTRITIRQRSDVIASWRAVHMVNGSAGKIYNVHGVLADKESGLEYASLPCSTGVNSGE